VLERDNWRCQIGIVGRCKGKANTADHIQAVAEGGALLDPANLRAACTPCNAYLGAKLGGQRRQYLRKHSRVW
jgi:5-methylcytosine-specific restriction endonuclease McrA